MSRETCRREEQPMETRSRFGSGFAHFRHGFNETGLFGDECLAELIDRYPREHYVVTTMTETGGERVWRNGGFGGLGGNAVLEAIRHGRLWLCLRRLEVNDPQIGHLVDDAFTMLEKANPDLLTGRRSSSLLISSPGARVHYHADIPMVALWHIRDRKRVWLYDAHDKRHLPDEVLERVVLRETEEDIP
jgi:hypothetical protein